MASASNGVLNKIKSYCEQNYMVQPTKKTKIIGAAFSVALLLSVVIFHNSFTTQKFAAKWFLLALAMILPLLVGIVIAYPIQSDNPKADRKLQYARFFFMPLFMMVTVEILNRNLIFKMRLLGIFGNYILLLLFYLVIYALTGNLRASLLTINIPLFLLAVAHNYVLNFRGDPLLPFDFFAVETAKNVAGAYNFSPTYSMLLAVSCMAIVMTICLRIRTPQLKLHTKIITRITSAVLFCAVMLLYFETSVLVNIGIRPDFWKQDRGYQRYGFSLMFFLNTRYIGNPDPPEGYSKEKVSQTADKYVENKDDKNDAANNDSPNIICIMNESLSDLSVLGDFTTNIDYMPFMRNLKENTVRGNLYVPVNGAGTSNTEFEFLTGHSTAFLPSGSNAYMLYVKHPLATMVSTLESQGYSSFAYHPYYASGWNRTSVYEFMGFDSFRSMEDIFSKDYMKNYEKFSADPEAISDYDAEVHPYETFLLRQYISDSYDYKELIENFENRNKNVPYFAFNVTMQNHGGYMTQYPNFPETVKVTSTEEEYPKTNQYLSLVKRSDDAFKELISYFQNIDEPTVICIFGDHQPTIENEFIEEVMGVSSVSLLNIEQKQKRYVTPFIIWANYDIEEQYIERLSVNYLSTLVMETAGLKTTKYNKALKNFYEQLPVINNVGYIDKDGNYYEWGQESPYTDLLNDYEIMQYNNIFDLDNRDDSVFYLNDGNENPTEAGKK